MQKCEVKYNWNSPPQEMICGQMFAKFHISLPSGQQDKFKCPTPWPKQSIKSLPPLNPPPSQAYIDRCIIKALFHNKLMVITWILEMGKRNILWAHICFSFKVTTINHNYIHACINISFCNTCLIALIFFFNKSTEKDHSIIVWVYTIKLSTLIAMIQLLSKNQQVYTWNYQPEQQWN